MLPPFYVPKNSPKTNRGLNAAVTKILSVLKWFVCVAIHTKRIISIWIVTKIYPKGPKTKNFPFKKMNFTNKPVQQCVLT